MTSSIQLLRSSVEKERPYPSSLLEGQPAINFNSAEAGLFFKSSSGDLIKIGPVAITSDGSPPNTNPAGNPGNSVGEIWLDRSVNPPVLRVYDGATWVPGNGTPTWTSGTGDPEGVVTAPVGSLFTRTDGGPSTVLYVKESGAGNTGWVAK